MTATPKIQYQLATRTETVQALRLHLEAFKSCAKHSKRATEFQHCRALEVLAASFDWKNYDALVHDAESGIRVNDMTPDAADLYWGGWCERVLAGFQLEQGDCPIDLQMWFDRITAVTAETALIRGAAMPWISRSNESQPVDPRLGLGDWRDAEFRSWIAGQLQDRNSFGAQPQHQTMETEHDNSV